jgi:hypothetical protein
VVTEACKHSAWSGRGQNMGKALRARPTRLPCPRGTPVKCGRSEPLFATPRHPAPAGLRTPWRFKSSHPHRAAEQGSRSPLHRPMQRARRRFRPFDVPDAEISRRMTAQTHPPFAMRQHPARLSCLPLGATSSDRLGRTASRMTGRPFGRRRYPSLFSNRSIGPESCWR